MFILPHGLYGFQNQLFNWSNWRNLSRRMGHIEKTSPRKKGNSLYTRAKSLAVDLDRTANVMNGAGKREHNLPSRAPNVFFFFL